MAIRTILLLHCGTGVFLLILRSLVVPVLLPVLFLRATANNNTTPRRRPASRHRRHLQAGSSVCSNETGSGVVFDETVNDFLQHVFGDGNDEDENRTVCTCQEQGKDGLLDYDVGNNIANTSQEEYFATITESIRAFNSSHTYACASECEHCYVDDDTDVCGFFTVEESASFMGRPDAEFSLTTLNIDSLMDINFNVKMCMEYTNGHQGTVCFLDATTQDDIIRTCKVTYNGSPCSSCFTYFDAASGTWCLLAACTNHEVGATIDTCQKQGMDGIFLPLQHYGGKLETPDALVVGRCRPPVVPRRSTYDQVIQYLIEQDISKEEDLHAVGSPQYNAANWLAEVDASNQPIPNGTSYYDHYMYMARYIMALNYMAMGGLNWLYNLNFLTGSDICDWGDITSNSIRKGVFCANSADPLGGDILPRYILLDNIGLQGELPAENGKLNETWSINVQSNNLAGTIPSEFCEMAPIPEMFDIALNKFSGTIPSCLGLLGSSWMALHLNELTGSIPDSFCHESINEIYLDRNKLSGKIPSCLGQNQDLYAFAIPNNILTGEVPPSLGQARNLTLLFLDDNKLSGNPLPIFNTLTKLDWLVANGNSFTGDIDSTFLANHKGLNYTDLSNNQFTSPSGLPPHLFGLEELEVLDLSHNKLSGGWQDSIPPNMKLWFLGLNNNTLIGNLPWSVKNLKGLQHLDISHNQFGGPMLSEFGEMLNLRILFLSENPFDPGEMPQSFANLTDMQELSVRNTGRTGGLPAYVDKFITGVFANEIFLPFNGVDLLDFGNNSFEGEVPKSFGTLIFLDYLLLNDNPGITGQLPSTFDKLTTLKGLYIDGTGLTGSLTVVCDLPLFRIPTSEAVIVADCGGQSPEITCECLQKCECCEPGLPGGCSEPLLASLEANWEGSFVRQRNEFFFGNTSQMVSNVDLSSSVAGAVITPTPTPSPLMEAPATEAPFVTNNHNMAPSPPAFLQGPSSLPTSMQPSDIPMLQPSSQPPSLLDDTSMQIGDSESSSDTGIIVGGVVGGLAVIGITTVLVVYFACKKTDGDPSVQNEADGSESSLDHEEPDDRPGNHGPAHQPVAVASPVSPTDPELGRS